MEQDLSPLQADEMGIDSASVIFKGDYKRIFRYIMSMVQDQQEAEDLMQETFLRAFRSRNSLRDENAQAAWLYQIATNVCFDRLRQYARRAPQESGTDLDQVDVPEPDTLSLQQLLERDEMSGCVQDFISRLPDSYRSVILLSDLHELTAPEIAQLLGQSLAAVKIHLHRARQKLRLIFQSGCDFSYDDRNVLTCESKD